jgi:hypothetical protein
MNVEVLDVIYSASIVLLHATAEWRDSLSLASKAPFLLRPHGEGTLKPHIEGLG